MPELRYLSLVDLKETLDAPRLSDLMRDAIDDPEMSYDAIPDDPSADPQWKIVLQAGESAEQKVESYVAKRYIVPFTTLPGELRDAILVIWKYNLFSRREALNDDMVYIYEDVLRWLREIRDGSAFLDIPENEGPSRQRVKSGFGDPTTLKMNPLTW